MGVDPGEEGNVSRRDHQKHLNWVFCLFFIELQLIYDVILVSGVHDSDLFIYIYIYVYIYIYRVGQNVCSGFSIKCYRKTQANISANHLYMCVSLQNIECSLNWVLKYRY